MPKFSEWTKRLGQKHWSEINRNHSNTLCGKPMLGNNYARFLDEDEKEECAECAKIRKEMEGVTA